ncbi:5-formyltetrahydrofolate cyclo-ligase [Clostridium botulinum]|uniref:5-formyltetrahydrofolate cyclo-ligase n=1 Tax=Clostridium botulinum TaxID=1491 RepID=A0A9Q1UYW8_CLOBO|nr:5-formyltetrahydrofolate cyclo-ligase [Clostridium botulinum]KEI04344.1 5-formyltetrahydrofolate cyclo-ligase [Clostridium botulinum C/D str. Sp77]KOA73784.1 5-formyltetrahydrofolate cyclo-ligase [Clostridium botulinum]KOA83973.1 5-formyltetrahydrofolate cyclo-ligase [Clostridium botulinum]KOA87372.1 5-formyltetrahydrofolate cyclo-ligase [Clostridium botulinum]KOA89199.1 5-formyltetrahydrofolate cyclo-ligase [Clostridium botulinum]
MVKEKDRIRKVIKNKRNSLNKIDKAIKDEDIFNKVIESQIYKKSKVIFIYVSFNGEVDTHRIIKYSLNNGKVICVPKVIPKSKYMNAVKINSFDELIKGAYGILEPKNSCELVDENDIDLVFMPGMAFDKSGRRIGYGGGFYDVFLEKINNKVPKIALAYRFQILNSIPCEEHDINVDRIISD